MSGAIAATDTVTVTATAINGPPTVAVAAGGRCGSTGRSATLNLIVADPESPPETLTLSATSSNQALVRNGNVTFAGTGANRTVTMTAAALTAGSATVTLTVSDGELTGTVPFAVQLGGGGPDALVGTAGSDVLLGLSGNDTLRALAGIDVLCGSSGNDTLTGGPQADVFSGGSGTDTATDLNPAEGDSRDGTIP